MPYAGVLEEEQTLYDSDGLVIELDKAGYLLTEEMMNVSPFDEYEGLTFYIRVNNNGNRNNASYY